MKSLDKTFIVKTAHSANQMGSGDLDVLATPAVVAFAENVCLEICKTMIQPTETTVGSFISVDHLRPSKIGETIVVKAEVTEQSEKSLSFSFEVREEDSCLAKGIHKRAIVDKDRFLARINK